MEKVKVRANRKINFGLQSDKTMVLLQKGEEGYVDNSATLEFYVNQGLVDLVEEKKTAKKTAKKSVASVNEETPNTVSE